MTTVVPRAFRSETTSITLAHSRKSRPVVGSSSTTIGGSSTMIDASAKSWRVPRFKRKGSASPSKPKRSIIASTFASALAPARPWAAKPNSSSSRTVLQQICRSGFWNRKPTFEASSLVLSCEVGAPSIKTSPDVGFKRPLIRRIVVDFPAPFVPTKATKSPSPTVKLTSRKMASSPSYEALTWRNSIMRKPPSQIVAPRTRKRRPRRCTPPARTPVRAHAAC